MEHDGAPHEVSVTRCVVPAPPRPPLGGGHDEPRRRHPPPPGHGQHLHHERHDARGRDGSTSSRAIRSASQRRGARADGAGQEERAPP